VFSIKPLVKAVIVSFLKSRPDFITNKPLTRVVAAKAPDSKSSAHAKQSDNITLFNMPMLTELDWMDLSFRHREVNA
jgi:hypothetical protein